MLRQATPVQHVKFPILYALLEFSKGDENSSNMRGECCAHVGRMKNLSHVSFIGENLSLLFTFGFSPVSGGIICVVYRRRPIVQAERLCGTAGDDGSGV